MDCFENSRSGIRTSYCKSLVISFMLAVSCTSSYAVESLTQRESEGGTRVRGGDSLIESLNIGPVSTEFWGRLQDLTNNPAHLETFDGVIKLFELTPLAEGAIDSPLSGVMPRRVRDLKFMKIESLDYGIGNDRFDSRIKYKKLRVNLNINAICISDLEVRRVFGRGAVGVPSHGNLPAGIAEEPTESGYSESYGKSGAKSYQSPVIFTYAVSGCLRQVLWQREISN